MICTVCMALNEFCGQKGQTRWLKICCIFFPSLVAMPVGEVIKAVPSLQALHRSGIPTYAAKLQLFNSGPKIWS